MENQNYCIVRDHCHYIRECRGATHSICNLKYSVPKKVSIAFDNGSNYDYRFIIERLAEEFGKTIFLFRRKHWKIHNLYSSKKMSHELIKTEKRLQMTSCILQFTDTARFMASSLWNLVNISEGIRKIKCKYGHDNKKIWNLRNKI